MPGSKAITVRYAIPTWRPIAILSAAGRVGWNDGSYRGYARPEIDVRRLPSPVSSAKVLAERRRAGMGVKRPDNALVKITG